MANSPSIRDDAYSMAASSAADILVCPQLEAHFGTLTKDVTARQWRKYGYDAIAAANEKLG